MDDSDSEPPEGQAAGDGASLVGTVVAERYRIEEMLGEGAMGVVFRAEHIHMQKAVAFKVLHRSMSSNQEVVRRFEREAVAAGRIEHPNVATATDFGRLADGSFYLVLEYINGQSLGDLIEETGPMEVRRVCRIIVQIAAALSAAHGAGIVHRDLKPENVMLPAGDHEGDIVKVLDFGMAKVQMDTDTGATKLTIHGAVYGTPAYMAPEQAAGKEVDHRADLYALGLLMYEMLTGKPPFEADQVMALLVMQMTEKAPPLPSSVPRPISKLVMKLLSKDPEQRPQTADEVLRSVSEFLGVPIRDARLSAMGIPAPVLGPARSGSVAARVGEQVADQMAKMAPALQGARTLSEPALSFLRGSMTLKGVSFPRWVPLAGLGAFVVVLLVLLVGTEDGSEAESLDARSSASASGTGKRHSDADPESKAPEPPDTELAQVIQAAKAGSDSALYALEQRDDRQRSLSEWMGLAQARLMRKKVKTSLEAYRAALSVDESVAADKRMLGAMRHLADDEDFGKQILDFAAEELGSVGADMLFHVWAKTSLKTRATTKAHELLTSRDVKKNYSPELKIAMELREAEGCKKARKLLPEVESVGDERSMTRLRKMQKRKGCGENKRKDCYPCLRKGTALQDAYRAAGMRASRHFELPGRWRFK